MYTCRKTEQQTTFATIYTTLSQNRFSSKYFILSKVYT